MDNASIIEFENDSVRFGAIKKIKAFKKDYDNDVNLDENDKEVLKTENMIKAITNKPVLEFDNHDLKKELIQNSFWMSESDDARVRALELARLNSKDVPPSKKMRCPGDNKHKIKVKKIFPLRFGEDGFNCFACKNKLGYQKIVAITTCGHTMCQKCYQDFCADSTSCSCGKRFKAGDVINMQETKSSFSSHNKVEAEKYQPAFAV